MCSHSILFHKMFSFCLWYYSAFSFSLILLFCSCSSFLFLLFCWFVCIACWILYGAFEWKYKRRLRKEWWKNAEPLCSFRCGEPKIWKKKRNKIKEWMKKIMLNEPLLCICIDWSRDFIQIWWQKSAEKWKVPLAHTHTHTQPNSPETLATA